MTRVRVDADQVARLGRLMGAQGDQLGAITGPSGAFEAAFGRGEAAAACATLLDDWTHERLVLSRSLHALGAAAQVAGGAYVALEAGVTSTLGGPTA